MNLRNEANDDFPQIASISAWLDTITAAYGLQHQFTYNTNSSAELTKVTFPYGGSLAWTFRDFTFSDSRVIRDMDYRTLNDGVNGNQQYSFYHQYGDHDYNTSNHYITTVADTTRQHTSNNTTGLQTSLWKVGHIANTQTYFILRASDITWATDSDGNPYIATTVNTKEPNGPSPLAARTDQTRDNFGNLTQMKVYDYNNSTTPARTFNNTYYKPGNYINNQLATSSVTPSGGVAIPLVANFYDQHAIPGAFGYCGLWGAIYGGTPANAREYDPTNNGNTYRGNLTFASSAGSVARCMAYDNAGVVLQTRDGMGHTVTSTPDPNRNYSVPSAISTGNLTTSMTWNGAFQPTGVTSPNNATTSLAYDAYGRPSQTTSPYGVTTGIGYSLSPAMKSVSTKNRWTNSSLDGFGHTKKEETGYSTTANGDDNHHHAHGHRHPIRTLRLLAHGQSKASLRSPRARRNGLLDLVRIRRHRPYHQSAPPQQLRHHAVHLLRQQCHRHRSSRCMENLHYGRAGQPAASHRTEPRRRNQRHPDPYLCLLYWESKAVIGDQSGKRDHHLHLQRRRHPGHQDRRPGPGSYSTYPSR